MTTPALAEQTLLRFLYRSPVALLQVRRDGSIELITPMAARWLMPLSRDGRLDNLFDLVDAQLPTLRRAVQAHTEPRGVIADGPVLSVPDGALEHTLSLCLLQIEAGVHADADDAAPRILVLLSDISLPLQRAARDRRALEQQLHLATSAAGLGSWVLDAAPDDDAALLAGLRWNDRSHALHGSGGSPLPPAAAVLARVTDADERQRLAAWLRGLFRHGQPGHTLEYAVQLPDGTRRWLCVQGQLQLRAPEPAGRWVSSETASPESAPVSHAPPGPAPTPATATGHTTDSSPPQRRLIAVVWDNTPAHQHRAALMAQQVAEEAGRARTQFLSRISHEFRTPLNAILGFAELLLMAREPALSPQQRRQVGHVRDASQLLLQLVSDLMDLSRMDSGALSVRLEPVQPWPIAQRVLHTLQPLAAAQRLHLALQPAEDPQAWVQADPVRLEQVLLNLVGNAIKYNRPEGTVQLVLRAVDARWQLAVSDTGQGMTAEQLARLFIPFDRLGREGGAQPGAGIGLVIAQQLVQAMGGQLAVESQAGAGSRFGFELARARRPGQLGLPPDRAERPAEGRPPGHAGDGAAAPTQRPDPLPVRLPTRSDVQGTVLCVDPDPQSLARTLQWLSLRPRVQLLACTDASQALLLAREQTPDLLLVNPDRDGLALWQALRQLPVARPLRALAVPPPGTPDATALALQAGMQGCVAQPLDAASLLAQVDRLLQPGAPDAAAAGGANDTAEAPVPTGQPPAGDGRQAHG